MGRRRGRRNIPVRDLAREGATVVRDEVFQEVSIPVGRSSLAGELIIPRGATGIVIFAHGSGSSRHSPRNKYVAKILQDSPLGTLLLDLLTAEEEAVDIQTRHLRFDIGLLARRLVSAAHWVAERRGLTDLDIGLFGSSTGAAAALVAAAEIGTAIGAVVSRGGRPDLAGDALKKVKSPVLLIVGGLDHAVIQLNRAAFSHLGSEKRLEIVPGATHLFEEPGTLETVAEMAAAWFSAHLHSRNSNAELHGTPG